MGGRGGRERERVRWGEEEEGEVRGESKARE